MYTQGCRTLCLMHTECQGLQLKRYLPYHRHICPALGTSARVTAAQARLAPLSL